MKKILLYIVLIAFTFSCTDNFEDFNTDKKNPATVSGNSLFSNGQKELADQVNIINPNQNVFNLWSQYWTQTTYIDESNYDIVTRNIPKNIYRYYYREGALIDINEGAKLIAAETDPTTQASIPNRLAITELVKAYAFAQMTDIFGMVPYSEALNIQNVYPKYDDGAAIYSDLIAKIDAAIAQLDPDEESFGSADLYYGGDVEKWIKFGNTLKIKIAITMADANSSLAKSTIESSVAGAFESSEDDCLMPYLGAAPNQNPIYEEVVASGRKDYVIANTIVDMLNNLEDPRLFKYVDPNSPQLFPYPTDDDNNPLDTTVASGDGQFLIFKTRYTKADSLVYMTTPFDLLPTQDSIYAGLKFYAGGDYGFSNSYGGYAHINPTILAPDFHGFLMTYTEMLFYLAEAAERGYNLPFTAEEYYNMGITNSILEWGGTEEQAEDYLMQSDIAYATAPDNSTDGWRQKIGTQSWIANYTMGLTAWTTWRRLDYPVFNVPEQSSSVMDIPVRMTFPIEEQTLNPANYAAAASAIGGDNVTTKLFWDMYDANE